MNDVSNALRDWANRADTEGVGGYVPTSHIRKIADALDAKDKRIAELEEFLSWAYDTLEEINPSNYDHDDACSLSAASVEVILAIAAKLNKEPTQ
jgi:hypothetical protein